ncbi:MULTISPECIES: DUF969 domain-containing protein [Heyndrickxia]|jgi:uncharacterized membrane protein|uniref:DUF969 domain-containing protein n=1 Tax=Heyndrickxia oleronia TaxID=38875 RepID=A0A8E2LGR3_9BACI|nr:DUF969 domain-containing protein [Heyndrickxia oleronia]NYV65596.1 DUF969 domain-containing protein [Bacillus sp. Gen3]OJH20822.1 hypothetical protein BLX88_01115 [Bacillus obstructivus]MCI1589106.1 DUF969 domain-containing protein [Heyndrickxia oleronia]MCI1611802.1 DUF969 domain-containing protein [Heyndrickxia oleronia]MCI1743191.1 DUF969 domain-containing protein [Heyndrickxia oleronia]
MVLIGVALIIIGFAFRLNSLVVVTVSGLVTGLIAGLPIKEIITQFGEAFTTNRYMSILIVTLPVIGLLERSGLQNQAGHLVSKIKAVTVGRILNIYLLIREVGAALGLNSIGGHPQTVRPLIAPMAEGAAEAKYGEVPEEDREEIRAQAAAADNIGLFFGEDIFVAVGAILLMKGFFDQNGIDADPISMALWGIPTAIFAFIVHSIRLYLFDKKLDRKLGSKMKKVDSGSKKDVNV